MKRSQKIVATALVATLALGGFTAPALATPTQADLEAAQAELDSLGSQLSSIEADLIEKSDALEKTKHEIFTKQDEIDETKQDLADARSTLSGRIRSGYKTGGVNFLEVLTQATSFEDLVSRIYYMDKINESDEEAIQEVRDLESKLQQEKSDLEDQQAAQEQAVADAEAQQADYEVKVAEAQEYYNNLDAEIQAQLQAQEQAANVAAAVAAADTSSSTSDTSANTNNNGSSNNNSGTTGGASGAGLSTAYSMIGVPYVYGGVSASGVDCSGLVCYSYGYARGRTTYDMIASLKATGQWKSSVSELSVGDLVFTSEHHVGIYIGGNQMIHAPSPGRTVCISSFWCTPIGGGSYY